ncbi:hypothetical protein FJ872_26270 [Mesorhizobium sp. B2-5-9]|uniref:hypothetical protein n=1 Tax=Mesorhizobium sp. B2-5-9 TaxID=2589921 RepID=UPI00112DF641|nr:hypothetical protein [Mesorhizobium sp. B2-5-9]TPK05249.1 hypothetical protein FJ872_26270 [Mesorhizobium sp. B2-5-9]
MTEAPILSAQVLALYDPRGDRWGHRLWSELEPAAPSIRAAFLNHHFQWDRGCHKASEILAEQGISAFVDMRLIDFQTGVAHVEVNVSTREDDFRFEMEVKGNRVGAILFAAANPYYLADAVAAEIERREESAA